MFMLHVLATLKNSRSCKGFYMDMWKLTTPLGLQPSRAPISTWNEECPILTHRIVWLLDHWPSTSVVLSPLLFSDYSTESLEDMYVHIANILCVNLKMFM